MTQKQINHLLSRINSIISRKVREFRAKVVLENEKRIPTQAQVLGMLMEGKLKLKSPKKKCYGELHVALPKNFRVVKRVCDWNYDPKVERYRSKLERAFRELEDKLLFGVEAESAIKIIERFEQM